MFPLSTVLLPYGTLPLQVFEPRYRRLVADCLAGDGRFGVVLIARGSEVGGGDERVDVGTVASIETTELLPDGRVLVVARGSGRVRVVEWLDDDPYPRARVEEWSDPPAENGDALRRAEVAVRQVLALLSELGESPVIPATASLGVTPDEIAWRLCTLAPVNAFDRQRLLEAPGPTARLALLDDLVAAVGHDVRRILAGG
jgi:uncharacterized protein